MGIKDSFWAFIGKYAKGEAKEPEPQKQAKVMKFGIDVSKYQGDINWAKVAQNSPKVDFAYIKATEGSSLIDRKCRQNALGAKEVGILVGYYHFATLNQEDEKRDAIEEATFFLKTIADFPQNDLPLVLDIESTNPKTNLDQQEVLNYILAFFDTLKAAGKEFALYSYTPFLDQHLPKNHGLGEIPLWVAQYTNRAAPKLPNGWNKWWLWQYLGSAPGFVGRCQGVPTACDLNRVFEG